MLVDGVESVADDGTVAWAPRTAEELEDLRLLVASAVGFDDTRGDQITIRSMEFQQPPDAGTAEPLPMFDRLGLDVMSLAQIGILGLVSLVLGLFVVRPILLAKPAAARSQLALPGAAASGKDTASPTPLDGEISGPGDFGGDLDLPPFEPLPELGSDPAQRLRQLVQDRQKETIEVLSQWMDDQEETAG